MIFGELVPHKTMPLPYAHGQLFGYVSIEFSDRNRQYIANIFYGIDRRRCNKAAQSQLCQDKSEVLTYRNGRLLSQFGPDFQLVIEKRSKKPVSI
ncbi:hypothetical protein CHS0354_026349 [Potamilus streckersoni]|uniref:Uncharacterized protein n=1 Tax=Potamilus streckersoni TaxID=2493646 RepID=A0AAE0T2Z4_9BIVA|nr:hypothetical protein CHS0354_026349 [Potamilus streckersoni]